MEAALPPKELEGRKIPKSKKGVAWRRQSSGYSANQWNLSPSVSFPPRPDGI